MKQLLTSGVLGSIELEAQKKIREGIQKRWSDLGMLDGLDGHLRENVATLYESQAKHLIYEASTADNSGSFETVVFPLIRRVFSKLLANDIVSVQAMNLPIGKLFYIKPVTSEREWTFPEDKDGNKLLNGATGRHTGLMGYQRTNRFYDGEEFSGEKAYSDATGVDRRTWESYARYGLPDDAIEPVQTDAGHTEPSVTRYMQKSLYDLFYDDFLYDNSKGRATIKVGKGTVVTIAPNGAMVPVTSLDSIPTIKQDGSIISLILEISGFSSYNASHLIGPDGNEMDTEAFLASLKVFAAQAIDNESSSYTNFEQGEEIPFRLVTQKYGSQIVDYSRGGHDKMLCDAQGKMYLELDLKKAVKKAGQSISGYIGVDPNVFKLESGKDVDGNDALIADGVFNIAWVQYDSLELESEMGEVSFQLTSATVSVEERKLRATWSPELASDVSAFHSIDAEAELTAILSEQIAAEVDREILRDLRKAAPWQMRWDYNGWRRQPVVSTVYTQKDWNQTLITAMNQISAQIQKSTLRGGANWAVASAEISAVFNDLEYFHVTDASAESDTYNMGIEKIGSLQGRYNIIVDPYSPHWSLIMGHHGTSLLDTGYVYAPYVPMALTPTIYNPYTFGPVKGIMTRYAKKLVNNRYYGAVRCDGIIHYSTMELR